jgi:hypothetical protein
MVNSESKCGTDAGSIVTNLDANHPQNAQDNSGGSNQNQQQNSNIPSQNTQSLTTSNATSGSSGPTENHSQDGIDGGDDDDDGDDDDSDGDDDGNNRKRKRFRSPERGSTRRRFACVYRKYDPQTYAAHDRRYWVCAGTGFQYISELVFVYPILLAVICRVGPPDSLLIQ